jgi:hypothetical protein
MKVISLIKQYKWAVVAFISGPIIVNILILIPGIPFITYKSTELWLGFFGNYSGGIVGGIVAFIVAKKQVDDMKALDEEKTKLSHRPFLRIHETPHTTNNPFSMQSIITGDSNKFWTGKYDFTIENIGLGTAIDIHILPIGNLDKLNGRNDTVLVVSEKREISITIVAAEKGYGYEHTMKVLFSDLLGNGYVQDFHLIQLPPDQNFRSEINLTFSDLPKRMGKRNTYVILEESLK